LVGSWFDITDRKRLESLQEGQSRILDYLIQRRGLNESLEQIVRLMEEQCQGMICSILRFDSATQRLHHGAAPSLPPEYNLQVDGLLIGPAVGSCGTAAYRRERVIVTDIETDPLWADFSQAASLYGLRSCWSQPIVSSTNQLLGTLAMYYRQPRGPTTGELQLIEQAARLAAIAFERYRDEEIMRQTERLASLGTFAAGIAHEINNPLGGIRLAVQAMEAALGIGQRERVRNMIDIITRETERCAKIVRGVLQFGRKNEARKQAASLNRIIKESCELTRGYAAERGATVEMSLREADVEVLGCVLELEQVFVNLIRNAVESLPRGAQVSVQTDVDHDFARVTVADNGLGMNEEQKSRVFDPFFTTRQPEGGTGLGMSIVHGIVTGHGGTIHIESQPRSGTTVLVCLPRLKVDSGRPARRRDLCTQ
jgi:signal transduction histidine kinase